MRYAEALAELEGRQPERMVPDLARITALAELLGEPQLTYPTIHVTGTNGKTTTSRLIASLACAHGLPTGLYTSPHLQSVTERITVCFENMTEEEFGDEYERLLPYLETVDAKGTRVTYFEALTALAYVWFSDKPVSLGVFEVGMGGAWDATNLVAGDVTLICPIALDHPELGSTLGEVASEKAGVIKPGKIAVVREQPPEAMAVIEPRCEEFEVTLLLEDRDYGVAERRVAVGGQTITVQGVKTEYRDLLLPLFGEHAARNTAAAIVALEAFLDRPLSEPAVRKALEGASSPGRLEVISRRPLVILDGAHNPAGAQALAQALPEAFTWESLHLVIGVSSNKDVDGIAAALAPLATRAFATRNSSERSGDTERVVSALEAAGVTAERFDSVVSALAAARAESAAGDLILVTGSLYTVADARRALEGS